MSLGDGEVPARNDGEEEVEEMASVTASTNTAVSRSSGSTRFRFDAVKDLALLREVHAVNPYQFTGPNKTDGWKKITSKLQSLGYNLASGTAKERLESTLLSKFKKDDDAEKNSTGKEPDPALKERFDLLSQIKAYKDEGPVKLTEPGKRKKKAAKTSKVKDAEVLAGEKLREAAATTSYAAYKAKKDQLKPKATSPSVSEAEQDVEYDPWSPLDRSRSPSLVDPQKDVKNSRTGKQTHSEKFLELMEKNLAQDEKRIKLEEKKMKLKEKELKIRGEEAKAARDHQTELLKLVTSRFPQ